LSDPVPPSTHDHAERERDVKAAVYSAVQRASLDGILLVDSHEKIISYNQRFVDIWKVSPQSIANNSDAAVLGAGAELVMDRDVFVARVKELYARVEETSRDEIPLKDGRTLDRYSAPIRLEDGTYVGRVWFFRDITEHKRADDKIREDASQFQALVEQQLAGIFIIRGDGILAYINPRFSALFGYTPAEVIGRPFLDVVADNDKDALRRSFAEHLEGGPPATQTVTAIKRKNGGFLNVLAHASIASYQGKPALAGILIDITERQRATDLLQASEERFRLLVEQAPDAIVLYDVDADRFVSANKSAMTLFGCSREDLLKLRPLDFFIPDAPDGHALTVSYAEHNRQALAGVECVFERRFRNTQGREGVCEVRLVRMPTVAGRVLRGSVIDITERRQAEQALAYRDRIVHAMSLSVADLVAAPSLAAGMQRALQTAAEALKVDRILILERTPVAEPETAVSMAHAWMTANAPKLDAKSFSEVFPDSPELADWLAPLLQGKPVVTKAATAPGIIGRIMRQMHNISTLMVPISVAGRYWGHIRLDDCRVEREWTPVEHNMLGTFSQAIGALIMREQAQASLQNSEERFRAVSDTAQDAIIIVDSAARVTYWNRSAQGIFGYSASEAIGKSVHDWLVPLRYRGDAMAGLRTFATTGGGRFVGKTLELAAIRKDGVEFPIELSVAGMLLGTEWHAVATIRDITERKRIVEQIRHAARHDNLTGLVNRAVFVDALQQAIARAERGAESLAVLYLDLDHFKDVNDTLGHPVGDLVLQSVAERLRTSVRDTDTVARFGGDEFALIQAGLSEPLAAAALANKLLKAINIPVIIQGNEIRSGASVGIAVYGPELPDAETLLSHADVALYRAKLEGRGTYRFFTDAMDVEVRTRVTLGAELRDAVAAGQIFLEYQPQIDTDTGSFVGVEALVRWRHPTRGLLPPAIFIPVAEQSGLIVSLGRWILREGCRQMKEWLDAGIAPPLIAVNVSGLQFKTPFELEKDIAAILTETALPPQRLELELTETVLMEVSREHNDALLRLRKAGHRIAIDDFGTGYSSLEYLGRFPVDRIKIAQNFIADLTSAPSNRAIVRAAIGLANELNLDVVVEGVETVAQLNQIRSWGCRKVQGYYFSEPLLPDALSPLLRAGKICRPRPVAPSLTVA
jgi:diguanylate cyclase (GGDEF)-like protein/PAS domain S-box-containing protein